MTCMETRIEYTSEYKYTTAPVHYSVRAQLLPRQHTGMDVKNFILVLFSVFVAIAQ